MEESFAVFMVAAVLLEVLMFVFSNNQKWLTCASKAALSLRNFSLMQLIKVSQETSAWQGSTQALNIGFLWLGVMKFLIVW